MGFQEAVAACFRKYVTFSGRATRPEYWYFALFIFLASIGLNIIDTMIFGTDYDDPSVFSGIFSLATLLPSISVSVRRLHDIGRSGWWWWLWLVPILGWIILIYWACQPGTGPNKFGPVPKGGAAEQAAAYQ